MKKSFFVLLGIFTILLLATIIFAQSGDIEWITPPGSGSGSGEIFSKDQLFKPGEKPPEPPPIPEDKPIVCTTVKQCLAQTGKKFSSKLFD